jgi:hypothetical protein
MKTLFFILMFAVTAVAATVEQLNNYSGWIDSVLEKQYTAINITPLNRINDDTFVRRAYLTIVGRNPTYDEYEMFSKVNDPNKRQG